MSSKSGENIFFFHIPWVGVGFGYPPTKHLRKVWRMIFLLGGAMSLEGAQVVTSSQGEVSMPSANWQVTDRPAAGHENGFARLDVSNYIKISSSSYSSQRRMRMKLISPQTKHQLLRGSTF